MRSYEPNPAVAQSRSLGDWLRALRVATGLTEIQWALELQRRSEKGTSQYVSQLENGHKVRGVARTPGCSMLRVWCEAHDDLRLNKTVTMLTPELMLWMYSQLR